MFGHDSPWNRPSIVDDLRFMWTQERKSASAIAKELNKKYNISLTRNAVIGKVDRLCIGRPELIESKRLKHRVRERQNRKLRQARDSNTKQFLRLVWSSPAPIGPQVALRDRGINDSRCHYIANEPNGPDTLYCSSPKQYGSWCGYHAAIVWGKGNGAASPQPAPSEAVTGPSHPPGDGLALSSQVSG